jgi:tripartite-type tricarboxylate transporter receptor subunit TctC
MQNEHTDASLRTTKTKVQTTIRAAACVAALLAVSASPGRAEPYPSGPITLVNPYAAGGPADVLARTIITPMSDMLGQPIVVLNKPGGATAVAAAFVAASAPDGQTVLMSSASSHIVTPALTKVSYDGMRDFAFVCMIAAVPNVLVVRAGLPVRSVPELVALAKGAPGKLNYASVGIGSQPHLAAELFRQQTGTDITHVPYKGAAPATVDLLAGQIDLAFLNAPPLLPHIQSGALRALAVARLKRAEALPDVPTLVELGFPGFDVTTWYGIAVPAGTRPEIVARLASTFERVLADPDVKAKLASQGAEVFFLPPKEFIAYLADGSARLIKLMKSANIVSE